MFGHKFPIRLSCFYPSSSVAVDNFSIYDICNCIKICNSSKYSYSFGDFNLPNIDWSIPISTSGHSHDYFVQFCSENQLQQHISEPTHCGGNILDLLLYGSCSSTNLHSMCIFPPLSNTCDHPNIQFEINWPSCEPVTVGKHDYPDFKRADYESICCELYSIDWGSIISNCNDNVQDLYDSILGYLHSVINTYVPWKEANDPPKRPRHIASLLKQKKKCTNYPNFIPP